MFNNLFLKSRLILERYVPFVLYNKLHYKNNDMMQKISLETVMKTRPYESGEDTEEFELHMLIGARHIDLCLWSVKSFLHFTDKKYTIVLHDDGTLKENECSILRKHIEGVKIIKKEDADRQMREKLKDLPNCSEFRFKEVKGGDHFNVKSNMFIMSLILFDFYLLSKAEKIMILDADVLFFKHPDEIIEWIENKEDRRTLYSVEKYNVFYNDKRKVEHKLRHDSNYLNTGLICAYKKGFYDLKLIERWIKENKDCLYATRLAEQICQSYLIKGLEKGEPLDPDLYSFNLHLENSRSTHFGIKRLFFENTEKIERYLS
ncbi:hypothetical protein GF336_04485 [Candidatus Woesearchaeota archaeon]|nr:hypothetical protein [Candidatus Woesearchaeota archaeon]